MCPVNCRVRWYPGSIQFNACRRYSAWLPAGYVGAQTVVLTCPTPGSVIYYTTNGSTPSPSALNTFVYTQPITVSQSMTINAIAACANMLNSAMVADAYVVQYQVLTPTISPASGITAPSPLTVTLACGTTPSTIYYTTNGTVPSATNGTRYTGPFTLTISGSVQACAISTGMLNSAVASAQFTVLPQAPAPTISASDGTPFTGANSITLTSTTLGAAIHYTLDGTTPTASSSVYYQPIPITATTIVSAMVTASGMYPSAVVTQTFTEEAQASAPTFSQSSGSYTGSVVVSISTTTANATIKYTTDGSDPSLDGQPYTGPITLSATTTLTARAYATGMVTSLETSAIYTITPIVPTPTWGSAMPGSYTTSQVTVTLSDSLTGATIRYTLDGSTPTANSAIYTTPIVLSATTTVNAEAFDSGYVASAMLSGQFVIPLTAATPMISPTAGSYSGSVTVSMTTSETNGSIHYTLDGSVPTASSPTYTVPITLTSTTTVKAITVVSGKNNSAMASALYTITPMPVVATPVENVNALGYVGSAQIFLTCATAGATIYYTTDGTLPVLGDAAELYNSTLGITITSTCTLKAEAFKAGMTASTVAVTTVTVTPQVATPVISLASGTYPTGTTLTMTCATFGATMRYTLDGSTPTANSPIYAGGTFTLTTNPTVLTVIAFKSGGFAPSNAATATYSVLPYAVAPSFSLVSGSYISPASVTLSSTTPGATFYYTLDGTSPTGATAVKYSGPIGLPSGTVTLSAVTEASGYAPSTASVAHYTIIPHVATPTATPPGGAYVGAQTVTLATTTPGAVIYYTVNGSTPSATNTAATIYTHPLTISASEVLKSNATATGYAVSAVDSETYTIQAAAPTVSLASGSYIGNQSVTLSCSTPNAVIYYTLNGSTPSATNTAALVYNTPLVLTTSVVLNACAIATGLSTSAITTDTYTIQQPVATPTVTPIGGTYVGPQSVVISTTTPNSVIYYTLNGSTPSTSNVNALVYNAPVIVSSTEVLKVYATAPGMVPSAYVTDSYTILPQVATPAFAPAPGTYANSVTVSMACATPNSTIRYTLNGTTPTSA